MTRKAHRPTTPPSLDLKMDINFPMQHVHLPPDPWHLAGEVDLLAEFFPGFGGGAERVHGRGDDAAAGFLIVEYAETGGDEDDEEDGNGADPFHTIFWDIFLFS